MSIEADRLRTLRKLHKYLVRQIEDCDYPGSGKRSHLLAEASALTWAIQELEDIRPDLHSHTIKVVKEMLVKRLRIKGVDESVIEMVRDQCNLLHFSIGRQSPAVNLAKEIAEQDD